MKKFISFGYIVLIIIFLFCLFTGYRPTGFHLPITSEVVTGITIQDDVQTLTIDNRADIISILEPLKSAVSKGWDSPSCPFGLTVICKIGVYSTTFKVGTDDCGLVQYGDAYYLLPETSRKELQTKLNALGLHTHIF